MIPFQACANIFRSGLAKLVSPRSGPSSLLPLSQSLGPAGVFGSQRQYHSGSFSPSLSNPGNGRIFSKIEQSPSSSLPTLTVGSPSTLLSGYLTPAWTPVRTILRIYWKRPKENKRIQKHGWKARMATPGGRRIIMRRILRGRHILSH